jgi:hypothetical protein
MRTVQELARMDGRIYVYLCNETVKKRFLIDAEKEGFVFGDGALPTSRAIDNIYAINPNHTLNFLGWAGHIVYHYVEEINGKPLIRIDYEKYLLGFDDCLIQ